MTVLGDYGCYSYVTVAETTWELEAELGQSMPPPPLKN